MTESSDSDITDVLKALNHEIRREIIRMLHTTRDPVAYSIFLTRLNLPASSNVAYHLLLLTKAQLVKKDQEGKYFLTNLGERSALLLDLASESKSSPFSNLYLGFSRLTPIEALLGCWWAFFLFLGAILASSAFLVSLILFSLTIASLLLIVYRTKVIWSILLLNNFIWIFFAPENRHWLFAIVLTNICGIILMFPEVDPDLFIPPFGILLGSALIIVSVIFSIMYLYLSFRGKTPDFFRKKRRIETKKPDES